jgi:Tol biopolymer transport system component
LGRLIRSSEFDGANNLIQRIEQLYDKANRLEKQSWVIDGDSYSESYTYDTTDGMRSSAYTATGDRILYSIYRQRWV